MATKSLNKASLIGHVGKDPEVRYTNNGKAVATFGLATSESWKDQSGAMQERTTWHNIVAWERVAEIFNQYVKKGAKLYIEGRIQNRSYDDKDGVKKYISEIVVTDFIFLDSKGAGERSSGSSNSERSYGGAPQPQHSSEPMAPVGEFDQGVPDADLPF
jgi:single-strand DNA-binding protein